MRILVTGAAGQLGSAIVTELARRNAAHKKGGDVEVFAASRGEVDVASRDSVLAAIYAIEPDVVIHTAAYTAVDACEANVDLAFAINALGTRNVQEGARAVGAHLAYISTDYVFDGRSEMPYVEWDEPNPLSVYGRSKLGGELECDSSSTIIRTSWVCGRNGSNIAKTVLNLAASREGPLFFVDDQKGSPTVAEDLATMVCRLAIERRPGIYHVTNQGTTTWFGFAQAVVQSAGGDPARVEPITTSALVPPPAAKRPKNSVLDNAALRLAGIPLLPDWRSAIASLVSELQR